MRALIIALTDEDHLEHTVAVTHDGPEDAITQPDGTVRVEDAHKDELKLHCIPCNVRLIEGEDYEVQESWL